jgi:hypothetical protein
MVYAVQEVALLVFMVMKMEAARYPPIDTASYDT